MRAAWLLFLFVGWPKRPTPTFVKLMRQKGHQASAQEMPASGGRAVEVRVPERNLAMVFATRELCEKLSGKP